MQHLTQEHLKSHRPNGRKEDSMRIKGIIKVIVLLALDFALFGYLFDGKVAAIITVVVALYAWLGEYLAMFRDRAVSEKRLNELDRAKLERTRAILADESSRKGVHKLPKYRLHVIPSDEANAFAYGISNISVTRGTLQCDEVTLAAVLAHEVSHTANLDAVVSRLLFANITGAVLGLSLTSFIATASIWIIFGILALIGVCGGLFSLLVVNALSKASKGLFRVIQHIVLFAYQAIIGSINKMVEYRCDGFAARIGLGQNLAYFLSTYVGDQDSRQRSLREILYDSHPATYKRVLRLEEHNG